MFRDYWDSYYSQPHPDISEPSSFARFCLDHMAPGNTLFELGCGNGRDALFFARHGLRVAACDQSPIAIASLRRHVETNGVYRFPPSFIERRFSELDPLNAVEDAVYSRFTLHAIAADEASTVLRWAGAALRPGGRMFIEARSVLGDLYGVGEPAGRDAFIHDGHFRRFIRRDELIEELATVGLVTIETVEERGLAVYHEDDPVVVRVVAVRGG